VHAEHALNAIFFEYIKTSVIQNEFFSSISLTPFFFLWRMGAMFPAVFIAHFYTPSCEVAETELLIWTWLVTNIKIHIGHA
jgi:hypothetical protein